MSAQSTLALTGTYNGYSSGSITATPAPFTLLGGRYILTAAAGTFPTSLEETSRLRSRNLPDYA